MGIARLTTLSIAEEAFRDRLNPAADAGVAEIRTPEKPQEGVTSAIARVVEFIPTEVVGTYISGNAILPTDDRTKWILFFVCWLLIPTIVLLTALKRRDDKIKCELTVGRIFAVVICASISYLTWVAALPTSPFATWSEHSVRIGGFGIIVTAVLLPKIAELFGVVPPRNRTAN